jgi:RNA polymerase-binding transcription factor DksA
MHIKRKEKESNRLKTFESLLRSRLAELTGHVEQLRRELIIDNEVDDEAMQAFRSNNREFVTSTMEREIRNISEIEQALARIAKKEYGICVTCETTTLDAAMRGLRRRGDQPKPRARGLAARFWILDPLTGKVLGRTTSTPGSFRGFPCPDKSVVGGRVAAPGHRQTVAGKGFARWTVPVS